METERPPKLNNRDSLLPPRNTMNKNRETVISSTKSTQALREKSVQDLTMKDRPSILSINESTKTATEDVGESSANPSNGKLTAVMKSQSFINKTALKKLINEKTARS